ncbi:MAG: hypothetical protein ACRC0V_04620 [Fusobacteriaceae bacterium]
MIRTMRADIYRIIKGNLLVVSVFTAVLLSILGCILGVNDTETGTRAYQGYLGGIGLLASLLAIAPLTIIWGHELTFRTINQKLIMSVTRKEYYLAKILLTLITTTLLLLITIIIGLIYVCASYADIALLEVAKITGAYLYLQLAGTCMGIVLFNICRTPVIALVTFILWVLIVESIIVSMIASFAENFSFINDTLIFSNIGRIIYLNEIDYTSVKMMFIGPFIYVLIGLLLGGFVNEKKELK